METFLTQAFMEMGEQHAMDYFFYMSLKAELKWRFQNVSFKSTEEKNYTASTLIIGHESLPNLLMFMQKQEYMSWQISTLPKLK